MIRGMIRLIKAEREHLYYFSLNLDNWAQYYFNSWTDKLIKKFVQSFEGMISLSYFELDLFRFGYMTKLLNE